MFIDCHLLLPSGGTFKALLLYGVFRNVQPKRAECCILSRDGSRQAPTQSSDHADMHADMALTLNNGVSPGASLALLPDDAVRLESAHSLYRVGARQASQSVEFNDAANRLRQGDQPDQHRRAPV